MFTVASDSSYLREPDLLYTFSVGDGMYRLVMDTKEVVVSDEYKAVSYTHLTLPTKSSV